MSIDAKSPGSPLPTDVEEGSIQVDLDPIDVWVLGQLVEAEAVRVPQGLEDQLLDGYRILEVGAWEPPAKARRQLEELERKLGVRDEASPDAEATETGREQAPSAAREAPVSEAEDEDPRLGVREVLVREVDAEGPAADTAGEDAVPEQGRHPAREVFDTRRLADAMERVAEAVDAEAEADAEAQAAGVDAPASAASEPAAQTVTVDQALAGASGVLVVAFALTAVALPDPIFAVLAVALLGVTVLAAEGLVEDTEGDR